MSTKQKIRQQLMEYFAFVGRQARVYGARDFNSHVMMNSYDPQERATLDDVVHDMLEEGVLQRTSPVEFMLTRAGLELARSLRQHRPSTVPS